MRKGVLVITDKREMNNMAIKISNSFDPKKREKKQMAATMFPSPISQSILKKEKTFENKNPGAIVMD